MPARSVRAATSGATGSLEIQRDGAVVDDLDRVERPELVLAVRPRRAEVPLDAGLGRLRVEGLAVMELHALPQLHGQRLAVGRPFLAGGELGHIGRRKRRFGAAAGSSTSAAASSAGRSRRSPSSTGRTRPRPISMTTTEQIIWAHRVDKDLRPSICKPGTTLRVYADLLPGVRRHRAVCHPHLQPDHRRQRRSIRVRRRSPTITSCSPAAPSTTSRRASAASSRGSRSWSSRTTRRRATASSISISPSRGW